MFIKVVKCPDGSTTHPKEHALKHHAKLWADCLSYFTGQKEKEGTATSRQTTLTGDAEFNIKRKRLASEANDDDVVVLVQKYAFKSAKQRRFDALVVDWILSSCGSFNQIDSPEFHAMFFEADPKLSIISAKKLSSSAIPNVRSKQCLCSFSSLKTYFRPTQT